MSFRDFEKMTSGMFERSFSEVRRQFEKLKKTAVEKRHEIDSGQTLDCDRSIAENRHNMHISTEAYFYEDRKDTNRQPAVDVYGKRCDISGANPIPHRRKRDAAKNARKMQPLHTEKRSRRMAEAGDCSFIRDTGNTAPLLLEQTGTDECDKKITSRKEESTHAGTQDASKEDMHIIKDRTEPGAQKKNCMAHSNDKKSSETVVCVQTQQCGKPKRLSIKLKNAHTLLCEDTSGCNRGRDSMLYIECNKECKDTRVQNVTRESAETMSTSIIASMGCLSTLNFVDTGHLSGNFSVSMHEIETQDVAIVSSPPARKRSLSIRKSSICNIMPPRPPARKKKTACLPAVEVLKNIEIVDILMEISIKKVSFDELKMKNVVKCGEATFSEVFNADELIYKIVPIGDGCTDMDAFCRESYMFSKLSGEDGVCTLKSVFVATGGYPKKLLNAWDKYKRKFGSDSERPTKYTKTQRFGVIVMENSGMDLEKYTFHDKSDVKTFLMQFIECIARLEKKYEFEHRDLHWGNVMIDDTDGFKMRIIDFSLSRMKCESLVYMDLSKKPWLFEGDESEDEQFGVYKEMKAFCGNDWSRFIPMSNVLWIRYIVNKVEKKTRRFSLRTFMKNLKHEIDSAADAVSLYNKTAYLW
eukprot:jgi/Antlo1/434/1764